MSWYYYEDRTAQRAEMLLEIHRRKKRGEKMVPLAAPKGGRKLAHTFWGKAWCQHLESHSDYEYRLPRGRSYLRQGNVYNLAIAPGKVTATVAGSSLYEVAVTITPLAKAAWKTIKDDCAGQVGSLLDLLGGTLGDGVLRTNTDRERGLFPKPSEIKLSCSCPDYADMCKHVAAVLYGVGVKLDTAPDLFFVLRSVDPSELLAATAHETLTRAQGTDAALAGEDLSALFGITLDASEPVPQAAPSKKPKSRAMVVKKSPKPGVKIPSKIAAKKKAKPGSKKAVQKKKPRPD